MRADVDVCVPTVKALKVELKVNEVIVCAV
jgi:hypothetical protein